MKWIFILISEVLAEKNSTNHVTPVDLSKFSANGTEQIHEDNSTSSAIVGDLESEFQFTGDVAIRGIVLVILCSFIFISSCMLKRLCRKKTLRRYQMLENNQLRVGQDDSDSD